jgi:CheY-like chemotaxis protein
VALSGYAQPEDRQRAHDVGFDANIPKPPDFDDLLAALAKDSERASDSTCDRYSSAWAP